MAIPATVYWIYILFDTAGRCLYVGQSNEHPEKRRFKQHNVDKAWWPDVDHNKTELRECKGKDEATAIEKALTSLYLPLYPKANNGVANPKWRSSSGRMYRNNAYRRVEDAQMAMLLDKLNGRWRYYEAVKNDDYAFGAFLTELFGFSLIIPQKTDVLTNPQKVQNILIDLRNMLADVPQRWQPRRYVIVPSTYDVHSAAPWLVCEGPLRPNMSVTHDRLVALPGHGFELMPFVEGPENCVVLHDIIRKCHDTMPVCDHPELPTNNPNWYAEIADCHSMWSLKPNDEAEWKDF